MKEAETSLKETELAYAKEMLAQIEVRAPQAGLLLYTDKADWVGKPVSVGERIMEIADPQRIELRIDLPVSDALLLKEGAEVVAFFDALSLESFAASVSRASYHAEVLPGDVLAYRVTAELAATDPRIRIGWQGSAKVYGERGPLAFFSSAAHSPLYANCWESNPWPNLLPPKHRRSVSFPRSERICNFCEALPPAKGFPPGPSSIRSAIGTFKSSGMSINSCSAGHAGRSKNWPKRSCTTPPPALGWKMWKTSSNFSMRTT